MIGFTLALCWVAGALKTPCLPAARRLAVGRPRPRLALQRQFGKAGPRTPDPEPEPLEDVDDLDEPEAPQVQPIKRGTLYVVSTPIGNLQDITLRALNVLKQVDAIAAEDTRHTIRLLRHFGIQAPLISHHEHNVRERVPELVDRLLSGDAIAVVSDAGTPGISDPGAELVRACAIAGVPVTPVPGACAAMAAVAASGLPLDSFAFVGFLPSRGRERREAVEALKSERRPFILYEAPHRLQSTLEALEGALGGERAVVLARELTKLHEEFLRTSLAGARAEFARREPRGEFTIIVSAPPEGGAGAAAAAAATSEAALVAELRKCFEAGIAVSEAAKLVAGKTGAKKKAVYDLALRLRQEATP
eukprot:tig00020943_g16271.t1